MRKRPSYHELNGKLKQGNEAASAKQIRLLKPDSIIADLLDLNYQVANLGEDLPRILQEITPEKYVGDSPPEKSYERDILNSELFAFKWNSLLFGCDMYFKFAVTKGALWIVSLHKDRTK